MSDAGRTVGALEAHLTAEPLYGRAIAFVHGRLPPLRGAKILEIGCGRGQMCALFASKGTTVFGLDVNADTLVHARRTATLCGVLPQCNFIRGAAESLPLRDGCVDLVYSRSTLQYMERRSALREIRRVLRPGGTLVLIENLPFNPIILVYRLGRWMTAWGGQRREYVRSIRGYLSFRELDEIGASFQAAERRYFHLTRMVTLAPFRPWFVPEALDTLLADFDEFILSRVRPARRLAWLAATVFTGLRKDGAVRGSVS